jgi:hypothetical protein
VLTASVRPWVVAFAVTLGALGCTDPAPEQDPAGGGADTASVAEGQDVTLLRKFTHVDSTFDLRSFNGAPACTSNALGGEVAHSPITYGSIILPTKQPGDEFRFFVHGASARPVLCLFNDSLQDHAFCGRVRPDPKEQGRWIAEIDTRTLPNRNWQSVTDYLITTEDIFQAGGGRSDNLSDLPWPNGDFTVHYFKGYYLSMCQGTDWWPPF